jgi:hypothetical protein
MLLCHVMSAVYFIIDKLKKEEGGATRHPLEHSLSL